MSALSSRVRRCHRMGSTAWIVLGALLLGSCDRAPTEPPKPAPTTRSLIVSATGSFVQVSAGWSHTCALRSDGVAECWGDNGASQAPPTRSAAMSSAK